MADVVAKDEEIRNACPDSERVPLSAEAGPAVVDLVPRLLLEGEGERWPRRWG